MNKTKCEKCKKKKKLLYCEDCWDEIMDDISALKDMVDAWW